MRIEERKIQKDTSENALHLHPTQTDKLIIKCNIELNSIYIQILSLSADSYVSSYKAKPGRWLYGHSTNRLFDNAYVTDSYIPKESLKEFEMAINTKKVKIITIAEQH